MKDCVVDRIYKIVRTSNQKTVNWKRQSFFRRLESANISMGFALSCSPTCQIYYYQVTARAGSALEKKTSIELRISGVLCIL